MTELIKVKHFTEYMNENVCEQVGSRRICKKLLMNDGTEISIQASDGHYCHPRLTTEKADYNFYDKFEVGYPSKKIKSIMPYAENKEEPTHTVYSCVPKHVIEKLISDCGGVKCALTVGVLVK